MTLILSGSRAMQLSPLLLHKFGEGAAVWMVVTGARMLALISEQVIVYTWVYTEFRQAIMGGLI